MKYLRLLRRQLHRQLDLIHEGKIHAARLLTEPVAKTVSILEKSPPKGDSAAIRELHDRCYELNELILGHFESEKAELAETILKIEVDRKIQDFLRQPRRQ